MKWIAVLTGDLIDYTRSPQSNAFRSRLESTLDQVVERYGAQVSVFRGDSFQATLPAAARGPEAAIYIRAGLIGASPSRTERWDARISVAVGGSGEEDGNSGPIHIASGRNLDGMEREHLRLSGESELFTLAVAVATAFVDDTLNNWTPTVAETYFEYLRSSGRHKEVALRLAKRRPTVTQALLRAKYSLLDRYVADCARLMELTHG